LISSGSFGDLGTLIPLFIALARQGSIYTSSALFLAGFSNFVTGYAWDCPMPVQPMKSIAAVAIAEVLSREQVTTAGLCMGIMLILLGYSNGIEWVNRIVPASVVSGMQVGVGLSLAIHGLHMIADLNWMDQPDCLLLAIVCSIACLYLLRERPETEDDETSNQQSPFLNWCLRASRQPPVGLSLFGLGALLAGVKMLTSDTSVSSHTSSGAPVVWALGNLSWQDWKVGFLEGALPQLPLSTLNSVISVCFLAHTLYPERRRGHSENDAVLSRREVCLSVGWMNLILCPFGAMPVCHGAGGLAAQHKFGARHGASIVFLGASKMLLALCFGSHILPFLDAIPAAIMGGA
jgi:MFS superfamily sulfate permease-like transporter